MIDTKERIARSNIYSIFGKLMNRLVDNNDDGEVLLKKAGLSSFIEEYENRLCPYWYNRGYQNRNDQYNPEYACISICENIFKANPSILPKWIVKMLTSAKEQMDRKGDGANE